MLRAFINCADDCLPVWPGRTVLTKRLHFFTFQLPKADKDHCALANCGGHKIIKIKNGK
jgi:hypothetical protein